jgi:glycolate oxidase FAD binding subunit
VTRPKRALTTHAADVGDHVTAGVPGAEYVVAPDGADAAAEVLRVASEHRMRVLIWGGGTHQDYGHPVEDPDIVVLTSKMSGIVDWQPEDLTLVVGAGTPVAEVVAVLDEGGQTPVLPEHPDGATIGGVVAAGLSGYRRLRYGPTRDRMLEVTIATGDGRVVTGGGRLVKNVTGYDLPRLATGSFGSFGVIAAVCLKLWPAPASLATVAVPDGAAALRAAYRPLAVVETEAGAWAYFGGTEAEVASQSAALGGAARVGLHWPPPLDTPWVFVMRVPARLTTDALERIRQLPALHFRASHGVGEVRIGADELDEGIATALRSWAESVGGALVVARRGGAAPFDPWGTPPASVPLQRRVKSAFDPVGVVNPGRLPGGI